MEGQPVISTVGPIVPRFVAAIVDNLVAMILAFCAAKLLPNSMPYLQTAVFVGVYLGYYFAFEALISRTLGKLCAGLIVVRSNGSRITARQAAIRTVLRVLEVNPLLLGALPAGLSIVFSKHRQRFGDMAADTLVVRRSAVA